MPPRRKLLGATLAIAGVLVAVNGLVSGPRAFEQGWAAVAGCQIGGLLSAIAGILVWRGH